MAIVAKIEHLRISLVRSPMFERDAIRGDENASAILAKSAMNKNLLERRLAEKSEIFSKLFGRRRREPADGNRNKMNAERFRFLAFALAKMRRFGAQIDNDSDAEPLKFVKVIDVRLRTTKK